MGHARWLQGALQRVACPARLFLGPGGKCLFREWGTRVIQSMLFSVSGVGTWMEVKDGYSRILPRAGPRFPQGWVVGEGPARQSGCLHVRRLGARRHAKIKPHAPYILVCSAGLALVCTPCAEALVSAILTRPTTAQPSPRVHQRHDEADRTNTEALLMNNRPQVSTCVYVL